MPRTFNRFIWRVGDLLPLKTDNDTLRTEFITVTKLGANDQNKVEKWCLLVGYRRRDPEEFRVVLKPKGNTDTFPDIKFCYRFSLKKGRVIVEEKSGCIFGDVSIIFSTPINPERITEGGAYVIHLWFDVISDQQVSPAQQGDQVLSASVGNNALLTRSRSALPEILAGSESPYYDLVIKIGEEKKFYVHRLVLAAHSPVFDTMLISGAWKERNGEVTVEDADEKSFQDLLHYLYAEKLPDDFYCRTKEEVLDLIHLAEKYDIDSLKAKIEAFLMRQECSDQDRYDQWVVSEKYRMPQLKRVCELILSTNLCVFYEKQLPTSIGELNLNKLALVPVTLTTGARV